MSLGEGLSLSIEFTGRFLLVLGEEGVDTSLFLLELSAAFLLASGLTLSLTLVFLGISDGAFLVTDQFLSLLLGVLQSSLDLSLCATIIFGFSSLGGTELLAELFSLLGQCADLRLLFGDLMLDRSDLAGELGKFVSQVTVSSLEGPDLRLCLFDLSIDYLDLSSQLADGWAVVSATDVSKGLLEFVDFAGHRLDSLTSFAAGSDLTAFYTSLWGDTDWLSWTSTWSLDWSWGRAWLWSGAWATTTSTAVAVASRV